MSYTWRPPNYRKRQLCFWTFFLVGRQVRDRLTAPYFLVTSEYNMKFRHLVTSHRTLYDFDLNEVVDVYDVIT